MRFIIVAMVLSTLAASAFGQGDVVDLKNGDRISGTIVKMDGEKLVITTPYVEKLSIDWAQVATLNSDASHIVRLKPDTFVTARFVKAPDGMQLESDDLRSARTIKPEEIATIDVPPGAQWEGRVAASIGGTSGNYPRNFAVGGIGEAVRRTDSDRLRIGVAGEYSDTQTQDKVVNKRGEQIGTKTNSTDTTASNVRGWAGYDYNLDAHWALGGQVKLENDRLKDLNLRTTVATGPRYRFIDSKTEHFSVYGGGAYINENYISHDNPDRSFFSAVLGDELHWKWSSGFRVDQTLDIYPNLENTSDILFSFYLGPRYTLANGLFAGVGFNWDYDTLPAHFREKSDFRYLGNVGYEF